MKKFGLILCVAAGGFCSGASVAIGEYSLAFVTMTMTVWSGSILFKG